MSGCCFPCRTLREENHRWLRTCSRTAGLGRRAYRRQWREILDPQASPIKAGPFALRSSCVQQTQRSRSRKNLSERRDSVRTGVAPCGYGRRSTSRKPRPTLVACCPANPWSKSSPAFPWREGASGARGPCTIAAIARNRNLASDILWALLPWPLSSGQARACHYRRGLKDRETTWRPLQSPSRSSFLSSVGSHSRR